MTPAWIALLVFVLLLVGVAIAYRNATLDKLPPLPDEEILFEEDGVRVEQTGNRTALFFGCKVRLTNHRLIVAQKVLFQKKYALRHVVFYDDLVADGTDLGQSMRSGYVTTTLRRQDISLHKEDDKTYVLFPLDGSALTAGQAVKIHTNHPEEYEKALAPV
jgi:hypothetical protein